MFFTDPDGERIRPSEKTKFFISLFLLLFVFFVFSAVYASEDRVPVSITVSYSGVEAANQSITVDYSDE